MTVNHDAVAALPISSGPSQTLTRNVLVKRMPYVLADTDDWSQLVETDPTTGAVIIDIFFLGRVFHLDATDTTTVGDGTSCLVTSGGKRYKLSSGSDILAYSVLSRTNTPPSSPSIGDSYLVTAAPTGAWVGKADYIAINTARGWEFINFEVGRLVYTEDVDSYWHKKVGATWVEGFGSQPPGVGLVLPSNMQAGGGRVRWLVENLTTNAPPETVSEGVAYIIGPFSTGAWAGQPGKIANGESGSWVIYSPSSGWSAYDKSESMPYSFDGKAWLTDAGLSNYASFEYHQNGTWKKPASGLIYIEVTVIGAGGSSDSLAVSGASSFSTEGSAAFFQATAADSITGAPGTGIGGDINLSGHAGGSGDQRGSPPGLICGNAGFGSLKGVTSPSGGGGGAAIKCIPAHDLSTFEVVTVGLPGAGSTATGGFVMVKQWMRPMS